MKRRRRVLRRRLRFAPVREDVGAPPVAGNVWTFPRELDNDVWTKMGGTISPDQFTAPDGTDTMDSFVEAAVSGQHRITRGMPEAQSSQPQTMVFYVRNPSSRLVWVRSVGRNGQITTSIFQTTGAGTKVREDAGHTSDIWLLANSIYAIRVVASASAIGSGVTEPLWHINLSSTSSSLGYTGNTSIQVGFWDVRYFPNTAGAEIDFPEYPTVTPGGSTDAVLRVGLMGMDGHVGEGPGGRTTGLIFRAVQWNPHNEGLGNVPAVIAEAREKDIILVAYMPGSARTFGANEGQFDLDRYEGRLDELAGIPAFNAAVADGFIKCYFGDEPNRTELWGNSWSPTLWNAAARKCKDRWPGCLTFGRLTPSLMRDGWAGHNGLTEYDAIDYGWLQLNASYRKNGIGATQAMADEVEAANQLDMGVVLGLNLSNAGYRVTLDGIEPCWDYANNGISSGVVIGGPAGSGFFEGQRVPCSQLSSVPTQQNLQASPALLRKVIDVGLAHLDGPFLLPWSYPREAAGSEDLAPYLNRADYIAELDRGILLGLARTTGTGYRTPKP